MAEGLSPLERLVYRSNCLGSDQRITNTGGGNTSAKLMYPDPCTGDKVEVLWVKGSGGDLRTAGVEHFAALYQSKLLALRDQYAECPGRGLKTPAEDAMVGRFREATFNDNPRAPSIDTPLHGFLPAKHVDHLHPNAVISIAASRHAKRLTREIFGNQMAYVEWMRPGFELGLKVAAIAREQSNVQAIMMGQHGCICWDDDDRACYHLGLSLIERAAGFIATAYAAKGGDATAFGGARHASLPKSEREQVLVEILPWLRKQVCQERQLISTLQDDPAMRRFVNSADASRLAGLGTSCPDHFLRTKISPLYVDWSPETENIATLQTKLESALKEYRSKYAAYYAACRHPDSPAMRDPNPTVVLIPGLGMIAWGKNKSESRVTAEFYNCAVEVMRGAEAIDSYIALPQQEAFDIEYWALEEAKLQRMPKEKKFARDVVVVTAAGSTAGKEAAQRLAEAGAHVACLDKDPQAAEATARRINEQFDSGIGVAGSGISACGQAIALAADPGNPEGMKNALSQVTLAYGGYDTVATMY